MNNLISFLRDSYELETLNNLILDNKSSIIITGQYTSGRSFFSKINIISSRIRYKSVTLKNLKLILPLIVNTNKKDTGELNAMFISKQLKARIEAKIASQNNKLCSILSIKSSDNLTVQPVSLCLYPIKKTLHFGPIKAKIKTKLAEIKINILEGNLTNKYISTRGSVKIDAFDGKIYIKNIKLSLKDMPILMLDVDFSHINLKKLTQLSNFGQVTGYIKGYIHNLALIKFKNPLSFNALVQTENVKGASQRISLKAVNSISKIGGGYVSIALPFFKSFSYSSIGVKAILKNNTFAIHGLYKNGNVEYIIKRGFFGGINVVNMNRNNKISWDDFLGRLKRVLEKREVKK
ncbi:hypothetical protein [Hippea maritima]|uniref:AsmA-like C-terminal domain-containing protein n=1 Tax=Hippea maritima (strain ATCC 700847 / DSM 10411 / MH2) TaxID=760142 RepID=F2LX37_HIPMA|nr:hypothetical protein [Hippea maritima]AEA33095.1 hypothetical protein Hipma_0115 [Hippea maritima DSM 10411]